MKNSWCIFICLVGVNSLLPNVGFASPTRVQSRRDELVPAEKTSAENRKNSKYERLMAKALENLSFDAKDMGRKYEEMDTAVELSQRALDDEADQSMEKAIGNSLRHLNYVVSESMQVVDKAGTTVRNFMNTLSVKLINGVIMVRGFIPTPFLMLMRLILKILLDVTDNICFITKRCTLFDTFRRIAELL